MRGLQGKVVIVAGATLENIGGAAARRCAEEGALLLVADIRLDGAAELAQAIEQAGGQATAARVDLTDEASVQAMVDLAVASYGGVDGLFNVAADPLRLTSEDSDLLTISDETWRRTLDVNVAGYLRTSRHVFPRMIERGGGSIVNTISTAAYAGSEVRLAYSTSKAAILALTNHTATLGGKQGIRCNAVCPGLVPSAQNRAAMPESMFSNALAAVRSPRLGLPDDIAAAVAFLLSDDATWINGQTLIVNGGAR